MDTKRKAALPFIGVTANIDDNKIETQTINSSYVDAIYHTGSIPLILPVPDITLRDSYAKIAETMISSVSGLFLTGGDDVNALLYGEENFAFNGSFTEERDLFEIALCRTAAEQKKPILGVCRGIQMLNVAMGGTLFQDITKQNPKKTLLLHAQKAPSYTGAHDVALEQGSRIACLLSSPEDGTDALKIRVNSFHHQAVKDAAPCFIVSATASDGIIEAIEPAAPQSGEMHPFTIGVQWHPERMWRHHGHARRLFAAFAEVCGS
jgi:putative glutamine amidotransferase